MRKPYEIVLLKQVMLKECKKCREIFPLNHFRKGRYTCKACRLKADRARRAYQNLIAGKYRKCYNCQRILPIERFHEKRNICKSCRVIQVTKYQRDRYELTLGDIKDGRSRDPGALLMKLKEVHHSPPGTKGYQR